MDRIERKDNPALVSFLQNSGVEQGMHIAMDGFDIAADPPRRCADRHRTSARHRADQFPALRGYQPEQNFGRRKADARTLLAPFEGLARTTLHIVERSKLQCYGLHSIASKATTCRQKSASNESASVNVYRRSASPRWRWSPLPASLS